MKMYKLFDTKYGVKNVVDSNIVKELLISIVPSSFDGELPRNPLHPLLSTVQPDVMCGIAFSTHEFGMKENK